MIMKLFFMFFAFVLAQHSHAQMSSSDVLQRRLDSISNCRAVKGESSRISNEYQPRTISGQAYMCLAGVKCEEGNADVNGQKIAVQFGDDFCILKSEYDAKIADMFFQNRCPNGNCNGSNSGGININGGRTGCLNGNCRGSEFGPYAGMDGEFSIFLDSSHMCAKEIRKYDKKQNRTRLKRLLRCLYGMDRKSARCLAKVMTKNRYYDCLGDISGNIGFSRRGGSDSSRGCIHTSNSCISREELLDLYAELDVDVEGGSRTSRRRTSVDVDCVDCHSGGRDRAAKTGDILRGIGAIITPLAGAGAQVWSASLYSKAIKEGTIAVANACKDAYGNYTNSYNNKVNQQANAGLPLDEMIGQMECNGLGGGGFAGFGGGMYGGGYGYNPFFGGAFNGAGLGVGGYNPYAGLGLNGGINLGLGGMGFGLGGNPMWGPGLNGSIGGYNPYGGMGYGGYPGFNGGFYGGITGGFSGGFSGGGYYSGGYSGGGYYSGGYATGGVTAGYSTTGWGGGGYADMQAYAQASQYQNAALGKDAQTYMQRYYQGTQNNYTNPWGTMYGGMGNPWGY